MSFGGMIDALSGAMKLVPNKVRGATITGFAYGISAFARASWNTGVKSAFSAGYTGFKSGFNLIKYSKYAKVLNIIGAVDIAGDFAVNSSVDGEWWCLIPGSGIVQLGAAVTNKVFGQNFLNAKFFWE